MSMGKTTPVPDLDALGDLALAAARNARRLLGDAEVLLKPGRWPSAYSLAVLALEEAGKAWMCVTAMMVPDNVRPEWPHGELIAKHADKLMAAHVVAHLFASVDTGDDMIASLAEISENLDELSASITRPSSAAFTPIFSTALSGSPPASSRARPGTWWAPSVACWITAFPWPIPSS